MHKIKRKFTHKVKIPSIFDRITLKMTIVCLISSNRDFSMQKMMSMQKKKIKIQFRQT